MLEFIRKISHRVSAMRRHTIPINELSKLDNRLLKDIGIDRPQVPSFINELDARQTF